MAWFKVDDKLWGHPKWLAVPMRARGLWVTAGSWCAANETDGRVPRHVLRSLGGNNTDAKALVEAALWREVKAGWIFHEWSIYQPDAASRKAKRESGLDAGLWGNHRRWHEARSINVPDCAYCQGLPPGYPTEPAIDEPHDPENVSGDPTPTRIGKSSPPNRPVPEPIPDKSQVRGRGQVSSDPASGAPPIQSCGERHPSAQNCRRCGDVRKAEKQAEAERVKAEKAEARRKELERSRQAIHGDDEPVDPAATKAAAQKAMAAVKAAKEKQ